MYGGNICNSFFRNPASDLNISNLNTCFISLAIICEELISWVVVLLLNRSIKNEIVAIPIIKKEKILNQ